MGDRGNIVVQQDDGKEIYFYTHWYGSELPKILRNALDRGKDRWNDSPYLGRIIFCEMVKEDIDGLIGYGISTYEIDNNHPNLVVNAPLQKVTVEMKETWSFDEFMKLNPDNPIPGF